MQPNYERVDINSLTFDPRNARKHSKRNIQSIKDSLQSFSQVKPIIVNTANVVVAGNGTLQAVRELHDETKDERWATIDIRRINFTSEEAAAYGLADNRSAELAEWDEDTLQELLTELDKQGWDVEGLGWNEKELKDILPQFDENGNPITNDKYTNKIKIPVYVPTGPKPEIKELITKIDDYDIPKNEKEFLKYAAQRHIVFNFQNIAEYYAQSDKTLQELFEDSALVLIDYEKAIENGFVKKSLDIAEAFKDENE